ncbi:MAG: bifunctional (p)ppGpp synthetase/guanosine-3',5'-bis(diphosphate) 3'-pyrophosphohydrolase [Capsulimonadaceae bacterium]|nr:bifunctional (p)ppGpp synthetase/guanosine-3',5'-bis(diphosphate) 3'-pyrophosphohydrolase [Capsulimonadaceae bacterium]
MAVTEVVENYDAAIEEGYRDLISKARAFNGEVDEPLIRRAFVYAKEKHKDQRRRSGEPYIFHPLEVAKILTEFQMGEPVLAAALLHDVVEDCGVTREDLADEFGAEIAQLVDGVTKLKLADFEARVFPGAPEDMPPSQQNKKHGEVSKSAANLRKILLAMARDLRVMIIKLADRLHNMRTLSALPPNRQKRVAEETLQIFAPLAHRLGIWQIKWQLEDLAFKYVSPEAYADVSEKVKRTRREREADISLAIEQLRHRLEQEGIDAEINGRPKHLYSIYNKMRKQGLDIGDIYDQIALRVIVSGVPECYHALGAVHDLWMPIPGLFDDYIAKPKPNGYQSLHTKVLGPGGQPIEIQIRTREMHMIADFGIAAHWQYKEGKGDLQFDRKMSFLRQQLFDWQSDAKDAGEFLRSVVSDLFTDQVFVFTPRGDVLDFPAGATPIDVAYRIHSDLGQHCVGAKSNGRIVPLSHTFSNGDIVEIISRPNANPSLDWLMFAKTSHARSKIKHYFRKARFGENVIRGREMVQKEADRLHLEFHIVKSADKFTKIRELHYGNYHTDDDLFAAIGYGEVPVATIAQRLRAVAPEKSREGAHGPVTTRRDRKGNKLQIGGDLEDVAIVRAKCCAPVPGDDVVGYMTRGKGIALHRVGCPNVAHYQHTDAERLVDVEWNPHVSETPERYSVEIKMELVDRVGLLEDVGKLFAEARTNIQAIRTRSNPITRTAVMQIQFDALDATHVDEIMKRLRRLNDVLEIRRVGANEEPVV